jgi:hypothetical protein
MLALMMFVLTAGAASVSAQDSLSSARDLYAAAAYEDALTVLDRLRPADRPLAEARSIEQYRAFCLLALGRGTEAERAIEAVVANEPMFHPSDTDVSPRVRSMFSDVRRRMLPGIAQRKYADAKAAYDRKDFTTAAAGFNDVLAMLADPDVGAAASQPPLSDVKTLAGGFRDLAVTASTPAPLPPAPIPQAPPVAAPAKADPNRIYGVSDTNVVPPISVRQELPPFPIVVSSEMSGSMDVVVDETGAVITAMMRQPVSPMYDSHALAASKSWRYRPATLNGTPVKYRKTIQIAIKPNR